MMNFNDGDTVCFIGDSITHCGLFWGHVYEYFLTRHHNKKIVFRNCGFAGFDSRWTRRRLEWDMARMKANKAFMMLGMNDVLGNPPVPLAEYEDNMAWILGWLVAHGIETVLLTPSPYDGTASLDKEPIPGTNESLSLCAEILVRLGGRHGCPVIDLHGPMSALTLKLQEREPSATLIGPDRVHPGPAGTWTMAYLILKEIGAKGKVAEVDVDAISGRVGVENCMAEGLLRKGGPLSFEYLADSLPLHRSEGYREADWIVPLSETLNKEEFKIAGLEAGRHLLKIDGVELGVHSERQLSEGLDICAAPSPQQRQSQALHELNWKRRALEEDLRNVFLWDSEMDRLGVDACSPEAVSAFLAERERKDQWHAMVSACHRRFKGKEEEIENDILMTVNELYKKNTPLKRRVEILQVSAL